MTPVLRNFAAEHILKAARAILGVSQRAIAAKAGMTQAVIARIELDQVAPDGDTLTRLSHETGHDLELGLRVEEVVAPEWLDEVQRIRALTAVERLQELTNGAAFFAAARRID